MGTEIISSDGPTLREAMSAATASGREEYAGGAAGSSLEWAGELIMGKYAGGAAASSHE